MEGNELKQQFQHPFYRFIFWIQVELSGLCVSVLTPRRSLYQHGAGSLPTLSLLEKCQCGYFVLLGAILARGLIIL